MFSVVDGQRRDELADRRSDVTYGAFELHTRLSLLPRCLTDFSSRFQTFNERWSRVLQGECLFVCLINDA